MQEQAYTYYEINQLPYRNTSKPTHRQSWWLNRWPSLAAGILMGQTNGDTTTIKGVLKFKTPILHRDICKRTRYTYKPITEKQYYKVLLDYNKYMKHETENEGPWYYNLTYTPEDSDSESQDSSEEEQPAKKHKTTETVQGEEQPTIPKTKLIIHCGMTGTGKTELAKRLYPEAYWKPKGGLWDNYRGETTAIIDNYTGANLTINHLLALLDEPGCIIYTGGTGRVQLKATTIVILTQIPPWMWNYKDRSIYRMMAIYRRITQIHYHQYGYNPVVFDKWNEFIKWYKDNVWSKLKTELLFIKPRKPWSQLSIRHDPEEISHE